MNEQKKGKGPVSRYYLVAYLVQQGQVAGNCIFEHSGFPSHKWLRELIEERTKSSEVVVTNIYEFGCKEDYEAFTLEDRIDAEPQPKTRPQPSAEVKAALEIITKNGYSLLTDNGDVYSKQADIYYREIAFSDYLHFGESRSDRHEPVSTDSSNIYYLAFDYCFKGTSGAIDAILMEYSDTCMKKLRTTTCLYSDIQHDIDKVWGLVQAACPYADVDEIDDTNDREELKFDIVLDFQEPTEKQRMQEKYLKEYMMVVREAYFFQNALLRILEAKVDFSSIESKERLVIRYKRTGKYIIDYSSIKDRWLKSRIKQIIEEANPIIS